MHRAALILVALLFCSSNAWATPKTASQYKVEIMSILKENGVYKRELYLLILGTMAVESDFGRLNKQVRGPALSVYQIEPATHNDIWTNYLPARKELRAKIKASMWPLVPRMIQLRYNLPYSTLMTVAYYQRICESKNIHVPRDKDPWSLAWVWKKYFNTAGGKGTTTKFFHAYQQYVAKS